MKTFSVYPREDGCAVTVQSERVYVWPDGRLSFFNQGQQGDVAGFAPGAWSYYIESKEGGACTSSSNVSQEQSLLDYVNSQSQAKTPVGGAVLGRRPLPL
jgi:hypothetical protein